METKRRRRYGFVERTTFAGLRQLAIQQPSAVVELKLWTLQEAANMCDADPECTGVVVDPRGLEDAHINDGMVLCAFIFQHLELTTPEPDRWFLWARRSTTFLKPTPPILRSKGMFSSAYSTPTTKEQVAPTTTPPEWIARVLEAPAPFVPPPSSLPAPAVVHEEKEPKRDQPYASVRHRRLPPPSQPAPGWISTAIQPVAP